MKSTGMIMRLALSALVLCFFATAAGANEITLERASINGVNRSYALYVPQTANPKGAPLLVLLHGSGGDGNWIAQIWKDKADREGIVLLAPDATHNDAWRPKEDSPDFFHALIDIVGAKYAVDPRRIYLFGQSGGAVYSLMLGMLESPYFAAVAIHAGSWRHPEEFRVMKYAQRKIPMAIIIGDQDEYFSMSSVQRTQDALKAAGFPIDVTIIAGQHHAFNEVDAAEIEQDAWTFLSAHALDGPPAFVTYQ